MAVGQRPCPGYTVTLSKGESPVAIGRPKNSSRLVVVLSAVLFLAAIVASASSFSSPKRNSLDEAEDYLRVPKRLANLAADHDDRDGLANIMREGRAEVQRDADVDRKKQQLHNSRPSFSRRSSVPKVDAEKVAEQHARILNDRDERAMMSTEKMVPWVHWPKGDDDMGSEFKSARKQLLLQMPMLMRSDVKDNAAAMMPLSEIMDRLKVDSRLHQGEVSDTELAMADQKAAVRKSESFGASRSSATQLDCKPFC
jgi:hypothetical protein